MEVYKEKNFLAVLHELRRIFKDCGRFVWPCERDLVQIYVSWCNLKVLRIPLLGVKL